MISRLGHWISDNKGKAFAGAAALLAAVLLAAFFSYSGWIRLPWMQERVFMEHGQVLKDSWIRDGDDYLYADAEGRKTTGLQKIDGALYYFDEETGIMRTGWKTFSAEQTDGPAAGEGLTAETAAAEEPSAEASTAPDAAAARQSASAGKEPPASQETGSASREEAASSAEGIRMYFRPPSGKAAVGWTQIGDDTYRFSEEGVMQTGWIEEDGNRYFLDSEGKRKTGWMKVDGEKYYLDPDGAMQTGWLDLEGKKYLLDEEGHLCTGRQKVGGKIFLFDKNGVLQSGWVRKDGKVFYYGGDGVMQTGLVTVEGETYYLSADGKVRTGWQTEGEDTFYVCSDGYVIDPSEGTGNYGRLIVHSAGLDVFLYTARSRDEYQQVVDAENSALVVQERRDLEPVIADRRSQGFDLSGVEVDSTAVLVYPDGTVTEFVCARTDKGINLEWDVIDLSGDSVWRQNEGGLGAYSSAGSDNREEVIVVYWEPVETDPDV